MFCYASYMYVFPVEGISRSRLRMFVFWFETVPLGLYGPPVSFDWGNDMAYNRPLVSFLTHTWVVNPKVLYHARMKKTGRDQAVPYQGAGMYHRICNAIANTEQQSFPFVMNHRDIIKVIKQNKCSWVFYYTPFALYRGQTKCYETNYGLPQQT